MMPEDWPRRERGDDDGRLRRLLHWQPSAGHKRFIKKHRIAQRKCIRSSRVLLDSWNGVFFFFSVLSYSLPDGHVYLAG